MNATLARPHLFQRLYRSLALDELKQLPFGLKAQISQYPRTTAMALLSSWSLFAFAIWVAVYAALVGAVVGFLGGANVAQSHVPGLETAAGVGGALVGLVAGFVFGFALVFGGGLVVGFLHVLVGLVCGAILAWLGSALLIAVEPWIMYFHGYRPPSHREERVLNPVLRDVARAMRLRQVPQLLIADTRIPGAWTHTRHIVVSKRLLTLRHDELAGILIHELRHWRSGHTVGLLYVSIAGLPLTLCVNLLSGLRRKIRTPIVVLVLTLVLWPYLLIIKFIIQPLLAMEGRAKEYQADAAATRAGYGPGLVRALEQLQPFEQARSGWETVVYATHPPLEYRIEAIEEDVAAMAHAANEDSDNTDQVGTIFSTPAQTLPPARPVPSG